MKKQQYLLPYAEVLEDRLEGLLCQSRTNEEFEEPAPWSGNEGWS